jgi:hypothetical protein
VDQMCSSKCGSKCCKMSHSAFLGDVTEQVPPDSSVRGGAFDEPGVIKGITLTEEHTLPIVSLRQLGAGRLPAS